MVLQRLHRHLYLRIWLAVVVALAVLTLLLGWLWRLQVEQERAQRPGHEIVVRNAAGEVIAQANARPVRVPGQGPEFRVTLDNGDTLHIHLPRPNRPSGGGPPWQAPWTQSVGGFAAFLSLVALAVALGTYPVVRRLTQRLEALQRGVEQWGEGDLSTRLPVQGNDEVAFLAQRFNASAERVQSLLQAHKALLANASHELRSPLARIRMGLELLGPGADATTRAEMARNITELDELVDEILLASRLDMARTAEAGALGPLEEVDLLGLAAEECARTGATLELEPAPAVLPAFVLQGHPRLLRRLLRNLLENARRHGLRNADLASVTLHLRQVAAAADGRRQLQLSVSDHGPGVPEALRERIFEPFYRLPGASERDGGVGLGLSLVRSIARRHGGDARCEAAPGGGARFVVELAA
jgi:two-component system, OmpR family, sensor kinase